MRTGRALAFMTLLMKPDRLHLKNVAKKMQLVSDQRVGAPRRDPRHHPADPLSKGEHQRFISLHHSRHSTLAAFSDPLGTLYPLQTRLSSGTQ